YRSALAPQRCEDRRGCFVHAAQRSTPNVMRAYARVRVSPRVAGDRAALSDRRSEGTSIGTCSRYVAYSGCSLTGSPSPSWRATRMYAAVTTAKSRAVTVIGGVLQNAKNQRTYSGWRTIR